MTNLQGLWQRAARPDFPK